MFSVSGKVVFITGGTSGIGLAVATSMSQQGASVIIAGRRDAFAVAQSISASAERFDVADGDGFAAALARTETRHGKIDVLINNAGMENTGLPIEDQPLSDLDAAVAVNIGGVLAGLKYGPRHMNDGGAIINTSSLAANLSLPTYGIYSATKAAVISLTRTTALELAPRHIRVNAVCPGSIRTEMLPDDHPEVQLTNALCPAGRIGETSDLTGVYQFLASEASSYISGQAIIVDGGVSAGFGYNILQLV